MLVREMKRYLLAALSSLTITLLIACESQLDLTLEGESTAPSPGSPEATTAPPPTDTPLPPTPTPTSIPTPTPVPSPALYLNWFNSPEDHFHSSARMSIKVIWDVDTELGTVVAQLPWVGDGIIEPEQQLLEEITGLVVQDPGLAGKILEYPWIKAGNGFGGEALKATGAIRAAAAIDLELARVLAGYPWLKDGINTMEANALAGLSNLAGQDVDTAKSLTESRGFASGTLGPVTKASATIYSILESDSSLGQTVTGYPWVSDGVTYIETGTLDAIHTLLNAAGPANARFLEELVGYSWLADDVNYNEREVLYGFLALLKAAGAENSGALVLQRLLV